MIRKQDEVQIEHHFEEEDEYHVCNVPLTEIKIIFLSPPFNIPV